MPPDDPPYPGVAMTARAVPTAAMLAAWRRDPVYRAAHQAAVIFLDLVMRQAAAGTARRPRRRRMH